MVRPRKVSPSDDAVREIPVQRPHDAAEEARERAADRLVQLAGARARDSADPMDPAHAAYFAWLAAERRAALPREARIALGREARAFAVGLLARDAADRAGGRAGMLLVEGAPAECDPERDATILATRRAPRFDLAVAAGAGRELWDEPAAGWVVLPEDVAPGQHVALTVSGDSMEPLLHAGDTILVRLGPVATVGDVIVARRPADGFDAGYVVKRVADVTAEHLVLASLNAAYEELEVPHVPGAVVGVVVLRWCAHARGAACGGVAA